MNFGKVALLALASASMVFMASCGNDEQKKAAPTIIVKNSKIADLKGAATQADFPLTVAAQPAKDLKISKMTFIVAYKNAEKQDAKTAEKEIKAKNETLGYTGKIELTDLPEGIAQGTITITAIDSDKNQTKLDITYNFGAAPTPGTTESVWGAEKQGAISHTTGVKSAAYDLKSGKNVSLDATTAATSRYMMNNSLSEKGFTAAWTSNEVAAIASPNNKGNKTEFAKIDGDYATLSVADAEKAFAAGAKSTEVTAVTTGNVYVAKLGEELYIIKITNVDTKNNSTRKADDKGCIEFSYKAKK